MDSEDYKPIGAFTSAYAGSRNPKLLFVAEAFGENEDQLQQPLVGATGRELWRMIGEAMPDVEPELYANVLQAIEDEPDGFKWVSMRDDWLQAAGVAFTNTFNIRPPANKLVELLVKKADAGAGAELGQLSGKGKYCPEWLLPEIGRLWEEIAIADPVLIVPLGATAMWAVCGVGSIGSMRGTTMQALHTRADGTQRKCLPTYHPANIFHQWQNRPLVIADLMKAWRQAQFRDIRRPIREVLIRPTLAELMEWTDKYVSNPVECLSPDIETARGQITCIGFAPTHQTSIVIDFVDESKPGWNYWPTIDQEIIAWNCVRRLLECKSIKLGQNFIYDTQYIAKMGIKPTNCTEDTMLLWHALYPEMQKGLGFLGGLMTDETAWKLMRRKRSVNKTGETKRDE